MFGHSPLKGQSSYTFYHFNNVFQLLNRIRLVKLATKPDQMPIRSH